MRIPTLLLCGASLATTTATLAQKATPLKLESATVFLNSAEMNSTASLFVKKGENEIRFSNVAGNLNVESIVVRTTNGVLVTSTTFQNNYLEEDEKISPKAQQYKDSIEILNQQVTPINNRLAVLNEQLLVLQTNRKIGNDHVGMSTTELLKMLELVNSKMEQILNDKNKQELNIRKINDRIALIQKQLDAEQQKEYQPGGQLLIKLYAKENTNTSVYVTYVTANAGWSPTYELWAESALKPVQLMYKANVHQNCGVSWDNVHLSLSTGNPQQGMTTPVLQPWSLAYFMPQPAYRNTMAKSKAATMDDAQMNEQAAPVAVTLSGSASMSASYYSAPPVSGIATYVTVDNSGVNTTFDIDIPYTIPGDGQEHMVSIKKYDAKGTFAHFAIPKMDKDAFLQTKVTGWEEFNLMPGSATIFYEGSYVGTTTIDPNSVQDTMSVSLGRDKKIVITRERDAKMRSTKTIGSNVRESFAYTISLRNTHKEPITIEIEDQIPVSTEQDIVIEDLETDKATVEETTGKLKWTLTIPANETKKVHFGFTVKYPKGKKVILPN